MADTMTMTADQIPGMIEDPEFAALPYTRQRELVDRAIGEAGQQLAQNWTPDDYKSWGTFVNKARATVDARDSSLQRSGRWIGEKAGGAAGMVKALAQDVGTLGLAAGEALHPAGWRAGFPTIKAANQALDADTSHLVATVKQAAAPLGGAGSAHRDAIQSPLDAMKREIDAGDFPMDDRAKYADWMSKHDTALMAPRAQWFATANYGGMPGAKPSTAEESHAWANGLSRPDNAGLVSAYMVTRDPAIWKQLEDNLVETPEVAAAKQDVGGLLNTPGAKLFERAFGPGSAQHLVSVANPLTLAGFALPMLRGGAAIGKVTGSMAAREAARRIGAQVLHGAPEMAGFGVAGTIAANPNATASDMASGAGNMMVEGGLVTAGMGAGGYGLKRGFNLFRDPSATGSETPGTSPGATAPDGTGGPSPTGGAAEAQAGQSRSGQTSADPASDPSAPGNSNTNTSPGGVQTGGSEGGQAWGDGSMAVNPVRQFIVNGQPVLMDAPTPRLPYEALKPAETPRLSASVNELPAREAGNARNAPADATNKTVGEAQGVVGSTPATGANVERDLFGNPIETPGVENIIQGVRTEEVPVQELKLSGDVPQFKAGADDKGVVEPLAGKYERMGTAPILVWERLNGQREVISGRHRFDLAKRTGERTIPAQVVREADGFSQKHALTADAEINIRDGQGQVRDYANYFRNAGIDAAEAETRGLLGRAKGRDGWAIGTQGGESLFDLHVNERLTDAQAVAIARAAPRDDAMQRVGIQAVLEGSPIDTAVNLMHAVRAELGGAPSADQMDLFGRDDRAMQDMTKMAKAATAMQRALKEQVAAVRGAVKRPDVAKKMGVDVSDPKAVQERVDYIQGQLQRWENWPLHEDLRAQVREQAGVAPKPAFGLESVTPEQLKAEQQTAADKRTMQERMNRPLQGNAGDIGTADMFDTTAGETPLFDQPMKGEAQGNAHGGWSVRNANLGERYKQASRAQYEMESAMRKRRAEIEDVLPPGWTTIEMPDEKGYDRYGWKALLDENGNDVAWPLSADEVTDRAWREHGGNRPSVLYDPQYQEMVQKLKVLTAATEQANREWQANGDSPLKQQWDAERAAQTSRETSKRESAAKGQRTRDRKKQAAAPPEEFSRRQAQASAFERASLGDDTAYADLDAMLRERYGQGQRVSAAEELSRQVFTQAGFEQVFEQAFAAKDFDTILEAMKQSDRAVYAPLLKRFFKEQADNPASAQKAEWMRHVFAGTRPPDAVAPRQSTTPPPPRQSTTPPPRQSTTPPPPRQSTTPPPPRQSTTPPPPRQSTTPPPPPRAPRIPVAPITGRLAKSPFKIIEDFSAAINKRQRVLRLKPQQLGVYRPGSTMTAVKFAGDLDTTAHELAGHWTDDKHGLGKPWLNSKTSPYDAELATFWIHGSPSTDIKIQRAEGIAEFIRAYVMNPVETIKQAPKFAAYFEKSLPKDAMKAINDFSDDVRTWAGENPLRRSSLNIRTDPPSRVQRLKDAAFGDKLGAGGNLWDKIKERFSDDFDPAIRGFSTALNMMGKTMKDLKPTENFELLIRWLSRHNSLFSDQLKNGLTPLMPKQVRDAQGRLVVDRIKDPVTGQPMNEAWLYGAFDNSSEAAQLRDMQETSGLMVAERTLERAAQIDAEAQAKLTSLGPNPRQSQRQAIMAEAEAAKRKISGLGAGMMSDVQAARETIAALNAEPNRARRLREAARRYRAWADQNMELLVESGRLSREQADTIKAANQHYVDMHRISDEFDLEAKIQGSRGDLHPGNVKELVKRFKGSTLEIENVYASLLKQSEAIQHEAMRAKTMDAFVTQLENARGLYDGAPVELDRIGYKASENDRNTVKVYRPGGRLEYWKFDKDIHTALKGFGDLGSHALLEVIGKISGVIRYAITRGFGFAIRNPLKDTVQRSIVSNNGGRPWDILQGYTDADKQRLVAFGGGMFGHYGKDKFTWHREQKRGMAELRKDKRNILMAPVQLWQAYEKLLESSETLGRVAEFRNAFEKGQKLGYDVDEAAFYAAYEAASLMDFAKMGSWMRVINKIIPFSNSQVRALAKTASAIQADPAGFALRWSLYVALPQLMVRLLAKQMGPDVEKEYQQLPAWQRDFFYNIKMGRYWLRIPKPYELGVMAGGVERALSRELGEKNSFDGYGGSVAGSLSPIHDWPDLAGPLKAPLELVFNKDTFRDRDIIPVWEKDLKLELRKGAKNASMAGQAVGNLMGVDGRNIDHLIGSFGGLGQSLVDFTKPERKLGESALKFTGVVLPPVSSQSKDYQWVMDWAKSNGKLTDKHVAALRKLTQQIYQAPTVEEADRLAKVLREQATAIREQVTGR